MTSCDQFIRRQWMSPGQRTAENAVDKALGLADKIDSGVVQGNPHPTPKTGDPYHASITLGINDIKGKDRVVSAHVYPDGTVRFSKDEYGRVKVDRDSEAPQGDGPSK